MGAITISGEATLETLVEHGMIDDEKTKKSDSVKGTLCYVATPVFLGGGATVAYKMAGAMNLIEHEPLFGIPVFFGAAVVTGLSVLTGLTLPQVACYFLTPPTE